MGSLKKFQLIRFSRFAGYRKHIYECLVLLYINIYMFFYHDLIFPNIIISCIFKFYQINFIYVSVPTTNYPEGNSNNSKTSVFQFVVKILL